MFSDHDNPVTAAAAAPAHDSQAADPVKEAPAETPQAATTPESAAPEAPVAEAQATAPAAEVHAEAQHEKAEAHAAQTATDAEATAAAEEAASKEEMSKLLDQYDEQQETAANNEIIEVKFQETFQQKTSYCRSQVFFLVNSPFQNKRHDRSGVLFNEVFDKHNRLPPRIRVPRRRHFARKNSFCRFDCFLNGFKHES